MKNKVIVIGGDHSNALGVIRAFGENGIKPFLFVISNSKLVAITKSKYIEKYWICKDEEEAILTIIDLFSNEKEKPVIIPTSDKAASILDCNFDKLTNNFYVQNMNCKSNNINKYMDKYEQFLLFRKYDVNMAKSEIVELPYKDKHKLKNIKMPIIIKPLLSIDGKKEDISIVNNEIEFLNKMDFYYFHNYKRLLIQELIDFDYECDMSGYCYNGCISISGYIQKERIWPLKRGSLTFGIVRKYDRMKKEINKIEKIIKDLNYNGMFDVEFFFKDNKFYLNEINFRNSGLTYLYSNSYLCYNYYLSCINNMFVESPKIEDEYYVMDELAEIHQIIDKNISIKQHFKDKKRSSMLLVFNKNDKVPSKKLFFNKLLNNLGLYNFFSNFGKIYHKSKPTVLLKAQKKDLSLFEQKKEYNITEITLDNINLLNDSQENIKEYKQTFKNNNIHGIVLTDKDGDRFIARGIIKSKGAMDRFIKINESNSYLFCNIFVDPKYRGKNYQCIIIQLLIDYYIKEQKANLYSVVYEYNIPSWHNFEKIGFTKIKRFTIKRFMKHSIHKEII
ncbi:MAG: ATP-grasp domain-containing protein [Firmicutes bacterium]|nr:ATP-grasp domain-containing protein [Bacillota bacterium]